MNRVLALVEGQTEEQFIKTLLNPRFARYDIFMIPVILKSKRVVNGPDYRGGILPYPRIRKQIRELLGDSGAAAVTTMFDYYALDDNFPGMDAIGELETTSHYDRIEHLETHFKDDINNHRFIPFLMLHEFETLLFSAPEQIVITLLKESDYNYKRAMITLVEIKNHFKNPEEINDNTQTCPNRRIAGVIPDYEKVLYGNLVALDIGLGKMQAECRHFREWLELIESL